MHQLQQPRRQQQQQQQLHQQQQMTTTSTSCNNQTTTTTCTNNHADNNIDASTTMLTTTTDHQQPRRQLHRHQLQQPHRQQQQHQLHQCIDINFNNQATTTTTTTTPTTTSTTTSTSTSTTTPTTTTTSTKPTTTSTTTSTSTSTTTPTTTTTTITPTTTSTSTSTTTPTTTTTSTTPTTTSTTTSTSTSTTTPTTTTTSTTPTTTSTTTSTSTSTTTPTTTTTSTKPTTTSTTTSTSTSTTTPTTTTTTTPPFMCKCGRQNPIIRIVGGQTTTVNEFPWQVGLTSTTGTKPYCGGSIVSNQWIVTAANCVNGVAASSVNVVVGEHNWATTSESTVTKRILASQIIIHPSYILSSVDNDIALIKLATPITFQPDNKIAPVCLPDAGNLYENVNAVITGWGTTTFGGIQPNELQKVTVPTLTNTQCRLSYGIAITANMICAGLLTGGKDTCQGDAGGPLITPGNTAQTFNVMIGVASWGYGCALPNYPGVYTRVTNYLSWINSYIASSVTCPRP
ncbi:serine proteinase stubble-like [Macrobrachium rosenbergii]|uniref:serine proteinase stubble-like n=1 Tax=Macrobrachium rosenbergii TaxID=79674 RepID=UPI0034D5EB89